jgi:hypothetical protein
VFRVERWARTSPAALVAILLWAGGGAAQISPGSLSLAHADLEGLTRCTECHGLREKSVDAQCLACHGEIARLREDGRGLHAREGNGKCAACHPEHGGAEFEIVAWEAGEPASFDHVRAGWALEGKHANVACERCHTAKLRVSPVTKLRQGRWPEASWLGLETECASCHADSHAARFGASCANCHSAVDWHVVAASAFDHERTRYPLRGRHAQTACQKCHPAGYKQLPAFARCADCHEDPHRGQATLAGKPVDCEGCHRVEGFTPSTYDAIRHGGAKYELEHRHATVTCGSCHRVRAAAGAEAFRFRPAFTKCTDCHSDPHGGQLAGGPETGRCERCHDLKGFRPSTITAAAHDRLPFPLEGAHERATCESCHGPNRPGMPPLPSAAVLGKAGVQLRPASAECTACHRDPHGETLERTAAGCRECHDVVRFHPSTFDASRHERTGFPLEGAHVAVPCSECHRELQKDRPRSTLAAVAGWPALTFASGRACKDCHQDPHGGQFAARGEGGDCATCHGVESFRPAVRFDHGRDTEFPLAGGHAKAACSACHREGPLPNGGRGVVFASTPRRCEVCHLSSPERGQS